MLDDSEYSERENEMERRVTGHYLERLENQSPRKPCHENFNVAVADNDAARRERKRASENDDDDDDNAGVQG